MHTGYFSAILDFNTCYKGGFTFENLPETVLKIISENFGAPIEGDKCFVDIEKFNLVFALGRPFFQNKAYHKIYIERGLIPKLPEKPNFAYLAAIFDIYGNIIPSGQSISFKDKRICKYLMDVFRKPTCKNRFILNQKAETIYTVHDIQKYLIVQRNEYLEHVEKNYGKKENSN